MDRSLPICLCLALLWWLAAAPQVFAQSDISCEAQLAKWLDTKTGEVTQADRVFAQLEKSRIVLLGEIHTAAAHHRWQHYVLAALHSRKSNMVVGFEMLPRRAQAVLDDWSAGKLSAAQFLQQSDWRKVWGYDADLYLPLLHFARLHRLPTLALNVDRELVALVGRQGWQSLTESQRAGLTDPAPASDEYRNALAQLYAYKQSLGTDVDSEPLAASKAEIAKIKLSERFSNFVDAQLLWDRAMAEALAAAHRRDPSALVVGIVGRGHVEYGHGIPHQLADMGIDDVDVLLPLNAADSCEPLVSDLATAVFIVDDDGSSVEPRARLGVVVESADAGVRVTQVMPESVAATSGIRVGDLIQSAAGFDTKTSAALIEVIQRQAPGTWLPLKINRAGKRLKVTAKFPKKFE